MPPFFSRWSESWRVLAITAVLAVAFIALERTEIAMFDLVGAEFIRTRVGNSTEDEKLSLEAASIAAQSKAAWASLPPGHRMAAFRIGYEVGWASEFAGSFAMSAPNVQAQAAKVAAARLAIARDEARRVGIDARDVNLLTSRTLGDFLALRQRFEADEGGLGQRVQERLTPVHRHLFVLGEHVGAEAETVESSGGKLSNPPGREISRHATLAGLPGAAWQPLVRDERLASPSLVLEHHRVALQQLAAELADDRPEGVARATAPSR